MKKLAIFFLIICCVHFYAFTQSVIASDSFEGTSEEYGYTADPAHQTHCSPGATLKAWERTDDSDCIGPVISGVHGTYYWVAEQVDNLNGAQGSLWPLAALTLDTIDISGYTDLEITVAVAQGMSGYFEPGDYLQIQYAIDADITSGTYTTAAQFIANASFDADLAFDANADGNVDGATLNNTLTDFTADLGSMTGDSISVRLLYSSNSFSEEVIVDNVRMKGIETPLPAELVRFSAKAEAAHIQLAWQTASELHVEAFELQKRSTGTAWQYLASLTANGHAESGASYQFTDKHPNNGWQYFRLKIIDEDGSYQYSEVKAVRIVSKDLLSVDAIFPNPVQLGGNVIISALLPHPARLKLNVYGFGTRQLVAQRNYDVASGNPLLRLNTKGWSRGLYILELQQDGYSQFEKLIIF